MTLRLDRCFVCGDRERLMMINMLGTQQMVCFDCLSKFESERAWAEHLVKEPQEEEEAATYES